MKGFKKILLGLLLLVSTISLSQGFTMGNRVLMGGVVTPTPPSEITLTSTSTLVSWSPNSIINTGTTLDWTVTGGVTIATTTIDDPTFNFSSNTGTANVLIENTDDLTTLDIQSLNIASLDISEALNLVTLVTTGNQLTSLDTNTNVNLTTLSAPLNSITSVNISTNVLLNLIDLSSNQLTSLDTGANVNLTFLSCSFNSITSIDISTNVLLNSLLCNSTSFSSGILDQIYIDLDNNGVSNGTLNIDLGRTSASDTARANLITKNWTIQEF